MSPGWTEAIRIDPIPALLAHHDEALTYFVQRDLQDQQVPGIEILWELPFSAKLVEKQRADGSWKYPGATKKYEHQQNYALLETYRNLRVLVEMYGLDRRHPAIEKACDYVCSCQTDEGDLRGILGNQYMPYYHGAILEPLIKAGFVDDPRIKLGLDWLLSVQQQDGGWIVPAQAVPPKQRTPAFWTGEPVPADPNKPHAHLATGMSLRALAAHPDYSSRAEVVAAGEALKSRFFKPDRYNDRKASSYWLKFQYPFWWNNLLTALDTLAELSFTRGDPDVAAGLDWFIQNQEGDGLWPTGYGSGNPKKTALKRCWVGFAISRVMLRYDHQQLAADPATQ